ncbi:hypothetical protein, partial [Nostoc sp. CHAB 5715]|uniref:hypothetical protein n=1 Tax=Nostoc sp. CHAB 5715 TaxID=2780400 RepID=UPI001E455796
GGVGGVGSGEWGVGSREWGVGGVGGVGSGEWGVGSGGSGERLVASSPQVTLSPCPFVSPASPASSLFPIPHSLLPIPQYSDC